MFKRKAFYEINSIHRDKEYYGTNFWDSGYKYSYTPTSYAIKYIREAAESFNKDKVQSKCIDWCVVKSDDEQELYIKITGKQKFIESFVTEIFEKDPEFIKRFTMKPIPSYYL